MSKRPLITGIVLSSLGLWLAFPATVSHSQRVPDAGAEVQAALTQYCSSCHNDRLKTAGLVLNPGDVTRVGDRAE